MKNTLPPPANTDLSFRNRPSGPREFPNPEHPLNRRSTYDPKEPKNIVCEANRRLQNQIALEAMDKAWGPGWRNEVI